MRPIDADKIPIRKFLKDADLFQTDIDMCVSYHGSDFIYQVAEAELKTIREILCAIKDAPTLDVAPVVHGEWVILVDEKDLFNHIHCTNCDFYWSNERHGKIFKYCPQCGAKMDMMEE